jgi:hypothetical protein
MKARPRAVRCPWCIHWRKGDTCKQGLKTWFGWHSCKVYEREPGADDDLETWIG